MLARACCDQHGFVTACVCKQSPRRPIFASGGLLLLPHKRQPASPSLAGCRCRELVFRARVVATRRALRIPPARFECDVRQTRAVTTGPRRAASAESRGPRGPIRRWTRARPADVIDLFVYVVVLNIAIEYTPSVIIESFSLSLLTAALLKIALELVILLKTQITPCRRHAARQACGRGLVMGGRGGQQARRARTGRPRLRRCREPRRLHIGDVARRSPPRVTGRSTAPAR